MVEGAGILNAYASRKWKNNGEKKMLSCCNDRQFLKLYSYSLVCPRKMSDSMGAEIKLSKVNVDNPGHSRR